MRAIVNTGPGVLELRELQAPVPGPGQALIRTAFCGICATDLQMIAGWERTGFPSIPGHEWSGVVESVGPAFLGWNFQLKDVISFGILVLVLIFRPTGILGEVLSEEKL